MAFRGYMALNGLEFANTSRVLAHIVPSTPTSDTAIPTVLDCACEIRVPYDDSWTGLSAFLGDDPYLIENAPWYDVTRPESAEFAGVWLMDVTGVDAVPVARAVNESIGAGGAGGLARDTTRSISFSAVVLACSNAGARFGLTWLTCILRQANTRRGVPIDLFAAHPSGTSATATALRREMLGVVLTKSPSVTEVAARGRGYNREATAYRVEWEMTALNPYMFGTAVTQPVVWDSTVTESITFAHAPDCESVDSCDLPTIFNADCVPATVNLELAEIPTCGGCIPLCSIERRTWEMNAVSSVCDETAVTLRVTNTDPTDTLTVNFYWVPCGLTDFCDRVHPLQVSGLAPGDTAVADSVGGRPNVEHLGQRHRQVGVVSTQSGQPWRPMTLDPAMCWELVAESVPGASYTVEAVLQDRDS